MSYWYAAAGLVALSLAAVSAPAQEQTAPAEPAAPQAAGEDGPAGEDKALVGAGSRAYDPERAFFGPLPRYRSPDGNISAGAGMLLQFDAGTHNASGTRAGTNIDDIDGGLRNRRAILLANALLYNDFILFGTWDFFDRGDKFADGQRSTMLAYRRFDPLWFTIGQQDIASPLDAARGIRAFNEEAMSSGAFGWAPGTPSLGVAATHRGPHHNFRLGLYSVPIKELGDDREGYGVHGRVSYAPVAERTRALHFGLAGYWRQPTRPEGQSDGVERFAARPEIRIDEKSHVVDTGTIRYIDSFHYTALELAGVWGPWSLQGEIQRIGIDRGAGPDGAAMPDLTFHGGYLLGTYFLTGESRNYFKRLASFWRVTPHREFDPWGAGGWGAFEVATRVSRIDLDDETDDPVGGVRGGTSDNLTLGINWYFNSYVRLSLNYVHADVERRGFDGRQEGGTVDAVGVRLNWEF